MAVYGVFNEPSSGRGSRILRPFSAASEWRNDSVALSGYCGCPALKLRHLTCTKDKA